MDELAKCGIPLRKAIAMGKAEGGGKKSAPKGYGSKSMQKPKPSKSGY